jgi:hypothetical protein
MTCAGEVHVDFSIGGVIHLDGLAAAQVNLWVSAIGL